MLSAAASGSAATPSMSRSVVREQEGVGVVVLQCPVVGDEGDERRRRYSRGSREPVSS